MVNSYDLIIISKHPHVKICQISSKNSKIVIDKQQLILYYIQVAKS